MKRAGAASMVLVALWPVGCAQRTKAGGEEAVRFSSGAIPLAGMLALPAGTGRHPAVVLFHGSGAQRQDLFTARWFASHGVAALTYDKRGVGESGGNFRSVPFMELCDDGLAAVGYLKSRAEIDPRRIGVWGLSQGGWLGPLAASRSADVAFVIAVSGPGVSPGEQMLFFYAKELEARGVAASDIREATALRRDVWEYMSTGQGYEKARDEMARSRSKRWYEEVKAQQDDLFAALPSPAARKADGPGMNWYRREMGYDPVPALRGLRVPALFLFGDEDRLVPVEESVLVIRRTLTESGHRDFTIRVLPHADHGMYVEGGVDPDYLETMGQWLGARVKTASAQ